MFSRLTKATNNSNTSSSQQAPPSATPTKSSKSSHHAHTKSQSTTASPSKIPVPSVPNGRSALNPDSDRSNYLSFLFSQNQQGAPTTPVKVNPKVQQSSVPQVYGHHDRYHNPYEAAAPAGAGAESRNAASTDDVHMQTMKNTVNPAMLKQLASLPPPPPKRDDAAPPRPSRLNPVMEDVHMRTVKHEPVSEKPRGLEEWEKKLLEKADNKRKATVAQLYFLEYYCKPEAPVPKRLDLLGYISNRKKRLENFKADTAERQVTGTAYTQELNSYNGRERVLLRKRRCKLRLDQFAIIAQVGQGGYGSVYLARKTDTREVCALKKMRKGTLAKMDEVKHVLVERDILTAVKTPWLVKLLYAFQDREHVYLAMEYVPGGDFRTLLNNSGVLKEEHARFYAAEMFMGVNELHKLGYIHRDLKPENFLVDGTGHVKLTDFGLATGALNPQRIESMRHKLDQVKDEDLILRSTLERRTLYRSMRMAEPRYADSVVGSPDYMPPEVLRAKTYTYSADYWSLGCILFEFLCGFPPFSGSSPEETWANLKNWTRVLRRPVYDRPEDLIFNLSDQAWDAVLNLIAHPKDRVATLQDVQTLPFFQSIKFSALRELPAPFVPMLEGECDVGYFDSFESAEDMAKYAEVFKKQRDVEAVEEKGLGNRNNWVGFTFGKNAVAPGAMPRPQAKPQGEALQTMF